MFIKRLFTGAAKSLVVLILALVVLWPTVHVAGTEDSEIVVEVMEQHVQVVIDDHIFWIADQRESPIILPVHPGSHVLRVYRDTDEIQKLEFSLQLGQRGVFTAWDPARANTGITPQKHISHDFEVPGCLRLARHTD